MKIKLTPEFAYIIGFWRKRRVGDGIGIYGGENHLALFSNEVLRLGLTTSDKLLTREDTIYFYHTAYKKFFREIEEEQLERFKYLNDYAASYLAGMFDACGEIDKEKGYVFFGKSNRSDEMLILRLGFGAIWRQGKLIIARPKVFLRFIQEYVKLYKDNEIFKHVIPEKKKRIRKIIKNNFVTDPLKRDKDL